MDWVSGIASLVLLALCLFVLGRAIAGWVIRFLLGNPIPDVDIPKDDYEHEMWKGNGA